jgi:hypothetical protein
VTSWTLWKLLLRAVHLVSRGHTWFSEWRGEPSSWKPNKLNASTVINY